MKRKLVLASFEEFRAFVDSKMVERGDTACEFGWYRITFDGTEYRLVDGDRIHGYERSIPVIISESAPIGHRDLAIHVLARFEHITFVADLAGMKL